MNNSKEDTKIIVFSDQSHHFIHPFDKKNIVFTGALSTMTRSEAAKKVRAFGGQLQGAVTKETDFVILGEKRRGVSTKQAKAEQLIHLGLDIQILLEDDFIWVLSIPKSTQLRT
ncbi:MAG TPA: BRCT domain-containing protein [Ureibacillus sp.]|nr:BRCT domain-containing protein [Ureibacillus sp.]